MLDEHVGDPLAVTGELTLDSVLGADAWARDRARALVERVS